MPPLVTGLQVESYVNIRSLLEVENRSEFLSYGISVRSVWTFRKGRAEHLVASVLTPPSDQTRLLRESYDVSSRRGLHA